MQPAMRNLLEELNELTHPRTAKSLNLLNLFKSKFSWPIFAGILTLVACLILINFTLPKNYAFYITMIVWIIVCLYVLIFFVILPTIKMIKDTLQWRKQYFESFITQINADEQCVKTLMKYSVAELERASAWIKAKLGRDELVLSLFGTNQISIFVIFSLLASAWAYDKKLNFHELISIYYTPAIYLLAFMIGVILGSIFMRILHKRYRRMQNWIELTIFEKNL